MDSIDSKKIKNIVYESFAFFLSLKDRHAYIYTQWRRMQWFLHHEKSVDILSARLYLPKTNIILVQVSYHRDKMWMITVSPR